jgi:hypothetical protein
VPDIQNFWMKEESDEELEELNELIEPTENISSSSFH